jgi:hypothetical protein
MFRTEERLVLQQITHAMNLYNAEHGRKPRSHNEFWEQIILANNLHPESTARVKLPRLPAGQSYLYDPRDGELKIRKPQ